MRSRDTILVFAITVCTVSLTATAQESVLYMTDTGTNTLHTVNQEDGSSTLVGSFGISGSSGGLSPRPGETTFLYGVLSTSFSGSRLIRIDITDGSFWDDKADWSPDGNTVYFLSDRDGFRCIYAQRLDRDRRPVANGLVEVKHFHSARRSILRVGLGPMNISVAQDRLVYTINELTGNIWLAELKEE